MHTTFMRHLAMVAVGVVLLALFTAAAFVAGSMSPPQLLLAAAGLVFAYIVVRLTYALFAAEPERRREARAHLILAAAVPALILTPSALGSSPADITPLVVLTAVVWLAAALSFTSYLVARSTRPTYRRVGDVARAEHARWTTASVHAHSRRGNQTHVRHGP